ncbi:MAG: flagellar protein FlgN [Candidatus Caenarcaniphilales bacterium]|jgi:hypothetical protein|nr:flagellar protein FlgN [Candidatus Caenarcaniphilales bacterium]
MKYLIDLLEKETNVYNNYLDLAVKKKKALIENDFDTIELITEEEKNLSTKVLALEAARIEFLREQGFAANIHINDLIEQVKGDSKVQLETSAANLRDVLRNCKKFHDSNLSLLKQSSNYINHMIKVFSTSLTGGKGPAIYSKGANRIESGRIADVQG